MGEFQEKDGYCLVWIDGASPVKQVRRRKPWARAGLGVWWKKDHCLNISSILHDSMKQTLNEAKIMAVVVALRLARRRKLLKLIVHTDSKVVILYCTEWVKKYQRNNWKTCRGLDINYRDSLEEYLSLSEGLEVEFRYVPTDMRDEGKEAATALACRAVEGALEGRPVTETITVLQRLGADVSRASVEHRANTGLKVLAKVGGFGPVVATVSNGSEITRVRGCLVSKLQGASRGETLILNQIIGGKIVIEKLVDLTVQVGDVVVDVVAAVLDDLPVPLILGKDWETFVGGYQVDCLTIPLGLIVNGRKLEPFPTIPYGRNAKKIDFIPACWIVDPNNSEERDHPIVLGMDFLVAGGRELLDNSEELNVEVECGSGPEHEDGAYGKYVAADVRIVPKGDSKIIVLQVAQKHREKLMI